MALPINHLISTLHCDKYEILSHTSSESTVFAAVVLQKATGNAYSVTTLDGNRWSSTSDFLSSRLNGLTRNDAGELPADFDCVPGVE